MVKVLVLLLGIVSVGVIAYNLGAKSSVPHRPNPIETKSADESGATAPVPVTDTSRIDTESVPKAKGKTIDLSDKGLVQTPAYVFDETATEILDLSNNQLTGSLQAEIRQLQNLKQLDLSNNLFTGVPAEIGQLKNLEVLDLSNNRLTGLPLELGNLSNLKVLNLKGNEYAKMDLALIKETLPKGAVIEVD